MANEILSQKTEATTLTAESLLYALGSPFVTPVDYRITFGNLKTAINRLISVTPQQATFITAGKNKFNKDDPEIIVSYYLDAAGVPGPNPVYNETGFIPVKVGTAYYGAAGDGIGMRFVTYYDINKEVVAGGKTALTNTFTPPAGVAFIRAAFTAANMATFQIEEGTAATTYAPYVLTMTGVGAGTIADGAVAAKSTNFMFRTSAKNMFDKATVTVGKYMDASGNLLDNATYVTSDYIPVTPGVQYWGADGVSSGMRFTTFFNASKTVIAGGNTSFTNTFTPPVGTAFVRITVIAANINIFQLEAGSAATSYEAYVAVYTIVPPTGEVFKAGSTTDPAKVEIATYLKDNLDIPVATDFALPAKIYWPVGRELELYPENLHKYSDKWAQNTNLNVTGSTGGNFTNGGQSGRSLKLSPSAVGNITITASVLNNKFDTAYTQTLTVVPVALTSTTAVKIMNVGDSFTLRSTFINRLMATVSTGVTLVGLRTAAATSPASQPTEGRGGWAMSNFVTLNKNLYTPFVQPTAGSYKYRGNTDFWKSAKNSPTYDTQNFTAAAALFDTSTGYLTSPNVNDVIYDNNGGIFVYWNGTAWTTISEATLAFGLNVSRYLSAWGLATPDVVHIMLGTNDFAGVSETTFAAQYASFKASYELLIAAFKSANAAIKIVIAIPCSSGAVETGETRRRKRVYWMAAKNMIADFGGREASNIYLVDYHSTVDRTFGYPYSNNVPFENYTGTDRERVYSDYVHLSADGFNQEGEQYMAIMQQLRG